MKLKLVMLFTGMFTACQVADAQRGFVNFNRHTLDTEMQGGSGIEVADIDGDGLTDIVAHATDPAQLVWYRNPDWQKYTISTQSPSNFQSAANDIDGDGDTDLVVISEFSLGNSTGGGVLHWFENPGDPQLNQEWSRHYIDEVPTSHRVKWGDLNGDGRLDLINIPIIGVGATAPRYDVPLQMKAYAVPPNLDMDQWPGVVIDESLELSHGMDIVDWDNDGRQDILTASFGGIHVFQMARRGVTVAKTQIGAGKQDAERPDIGTSEVSLGALGGSERFIAAIEPWHGNEVVVYTQGMGQFWSRAVIDNELAGGHGLLTADLDNDGVDEIIAGGRAEPYQLAIYSNIETGWRRFDMDDGGIAVTGLAVDDINGDGLQDIIGIGSATRNLVYYENIGR